MLRSLPGPRHRFALLVLLALLAPLASGCGSSRAPASDGPSRVDAGTVDGPRRDGVPPGDRGAPAPDRDPLCSPAVKPQPGTVVTDRGAVSGVHAGATWAYRGIPFAAPPVGPLRFRPAAPPACWGQRAATDFGAACLQRDAAGATEGSEDCLTLNVWVPDGPPPTGEQAYAVVFFVHGGGNIQGASSERTADGVFLYDGQELATRGRVVVVTANYRLGALGFLAHPALAAESAGKSSGNYGLLDQLAALQWLQRNAVAFGADPHRVLLFGESAGALDTCLLLTSPLAKGLFSAALMESGGCAARLKADAEAFGAKWATAAGCDKAPDVPACLRALGASVVAATLPQKIDLAGKQGDYQPTIDGWVLPQAPLERIAAGLHNQVPLIVGANGDETGKAVPTMTAPEYQAAVYALAGNVTLGNAILAQYPVSDYASVPRRAFVALTSDAKFICPARKIARVAAAAQTAPVYRYFFTHALTNGGLVTQALGAFHGLELTFVFYHLNVAGYTPSAPEVSLAESIVGYWSRLAARGDPGDSAAVSWPRYTGATDPYLQLETPIAAGQGVRTKQCDFWDTIIP